MAAFPLEPYHARAVIASREHGCTHEILNIISVLSASSKLFFDTADQRDAALAARLKFRHQSGDHMTILNAVHAYEDIAKVESRGGRKDWCRKQFLNERCLTEALEIRNQLRTICERMHIDRKASSDNNEEAVLKCLGLALVQNSAFLQPDGSYKQTLGQSVRINISGPSLCLTHSNLQFIKVHPSSVLSDKKVPAIIYDELVRGPRPIFRRCVF